MDAKKLIELRRQAEKAVGDMPDGDLKVKAFEVILSHLLPGGEVTAPRAAASAAPAEAKARKEGLKSKSVSGRILVLEDEGFFRNQKTLPEVQEELRAHGWHYAQSNLSGPLQLLAQRRQLRRQLVKHGNKKVWKYSSS